MDRQTAWNIFLHTGRVEDYLRYAKLQSIYPMHGSDLAGMEDEAESAPDDGWSGTGNSQYGGL